MLSVDHFLLCGEAFSPSRQAFEAIIEELSGPGAGTLAHAEVEDQLMKQGRELLRLLFQGHLDLRAGTETRLEQVVDARGIDHRAVESGHRRQLTTVFGRVEVERLAYRAAGACNLSPADMALNLPAEMHSHSLRRLAAIEAVRGSFDDAHAAVTRACGPVAGKRQIEQLTVRAAVDIDAFYAAAVPEPCTDTTLLVLSSDGKGIVMRPEGLRASTRKAAAAKGGNIYTTRVASGEKTGRKRMATLGTVYDADPVPRRPHDVITLAPATADAGSKVPAESPAGRRRKGPVAGAKWLTGSVADSGGQVIASVFDQATQRDPTHRRTWVMLVDGARHQLDLIGAEAIRRGVTLHVIIDFIHVLEYLWRSGWCFHATGDPAIEGWVAAHALRILQGRSAEVATALAQQADLAGLTPDQRKGVDTCIGYLTAKREFLGYDTALAKGWPIATGVIEGACRHLIKDRLDITGARWSLQGAEAVLKLRAVHSNGDFDAYFAWHLQRERERVHQTRYQANLALTA